MFPSWEVKKAYVMRFCLPAFSGLSLLLPLLGYFFNQPPNHHENYFNFSSIFNAIGFQMASPTVL
jgi:hypothetical protein